MAGLGTPATTSIITGGLDCTPACIGLITSKFSLYCTEIPPIPPGELSGGGPYPADQGAWNQVQDIQDFYQPVPDQDPFIVPRDDEADFFRKKVIVTIKMDMGPFKANKTYAVPEKRHGTILTVFNLMNVTRDRVAVVVKNIKRVVTKAKVAISNLRVKRR